MSGRMPVDTLQLPDDGLFVGRVWRPELQGPSVVTLRDGRVVDITCREFPTMRDLLELDDPVAAVRAARGEDAGSLADIAAQSVEPKADAAVAPICSRRATCRRSRPAASPSRAR